MLFRLQSCFALTNTAGSFQALKFKHFDYIVCLYFTHDFDFSKSTMNTMYPSCVELSVCSIKKFPVLRCTRMLNLIVIFKNKSVTLSQMLHEV